MFHYSAYNLRIASDVPLPELSSASEGRDIEVRLIEGQRVLEQRSIEWDAALPMARFAFPGAGRFLVRDGTRVLVAPDLPADLPLLRLYIQGMMLAALLYQRGLFVLHASVIQVADRAVAFVGPVGAGKLTLAAAFHAHGYSVVADDNAAVELRGGSLLVLPAFPSLKVYPDIAGTLGYDAASLEAMHDSQKKRSQRVTAFAANPVRLDRIYVLERKAPEQAVRLAPVEAVTELVRHSVPTRWGVAGDATHLAMCGQLAGAVPLFRVRTFSGLQEIPNLVKGIEEHCAGLTPSAAYQDQDPQACRNGLRTCAR